MTDELVAYLLDDLSPERRAEIERRLETDAAWRDEFDRLRECFASSADPAECIEGQTAETTETVDPPRDLVERTCCYVEKSRECQPTSPAAAAIVSAQTICAGGAAAPWSLADFTVGGGVLLVLGMLVLPALQESRNAARRLTCQDNLRALGTGLFQYQENYGRWLPPVGPGQSGAQYAAALAERVGFRREELAPMLVCPDSPDADWISNLKAAVRVPTYVQLESAADSNPQDKQAQTKPPWAGYYAYEVGYWDERGAYHYVKYTGSADKAMLADAPELSPEGVRSGSHGGGAQNVLDQSLSVKFRTNCDLARRLDNIYLNQAGEHDAGRNPRDTVLIRGDARPSAPVIWLNGTWPQTPR
jgi:hypothetical protein